MDGLYWKTLLKWMIWGYHYFWKHPCGCFLVVDVFPEIPLAGDATGSFQAGDDGDAMGVT